MTVNLPERNAVMEDVFFSVKVASSVVFSAPGGGGKFSQVSSNCSNVTLG